MAEYITRRTRANRLLQLTHSTQARCLDALVVRVPCSRISQSRIEYLR